MQVRESEYAALAVFFRGLPGGLIVNGMQRADVMIEMILAWVVRYLSHDILY